MNKGILFVDDDIQILKSLTRVFHNKEYRIYTADNVNEAISVLEKEKIDLVISDMKMPDKNGIEFLSTIKNKFPKVIRILLSGYYDDNAILQAINNNIIISYFIKPWNNNEIINYVDNALKIYDIPVNDNIIDKFNSTEFLVTSKKIHMNLISFLNDNDDIEKISTEIEKDQVLAFLIMRLANTYNYVNKVYTVKDAILRIGLKNTKEVIISKNIFNSSELIANIQYEKSFRKEIDFLWKHSSNCAIISSLLYKNIFQTNLPDSFKSACILHDIGRVFLLTVHTEKYLNLVNMCHDLLTYQKKEVEYFQVNHENIGACLLKWWNMPKLIIEASLYHHNPFNEQIENKELIFLLNIADCLSYKFMDYNYRGCYSDEALEYFDLTNTDCENILKNMNTL